ncbi:hypothetical protein MFORT_06651 [Mycolicibacterium fortuitum subsp. fortuitum DSM 46621 = ATCC 6841 = JCM 6387]|uniref:ATP/GTP-binding protein n=3 Tax=Mycobacteriaceae TaxID=1762 RepID=A0A378UVU5_MYCFO|nr:MULTISPECIES: hypothetical protein [Mycolicibacterium]AIY47664.1 hypothetical protein G155_21225 [Mycobacterium sp. VKM Ac-1817D]EJZ15070.1 hypothetical protein MFORT_06651 [Mycolicibacterium fortuitum subsp. fortuitum DSM 46621 = ATCC 6841 = JCM 6387]WEV31207.1 hypothetical protein OMF10_21475 [Mycolicibacterium fortuitum]STZ88189.1 Uncharacterised protein [Mycolicibacterium fortuitum]
MRRRPREHRRLASLPPSRRIETGPDGYDYEVRTVAASRAVKVYRCPGCDHEIRVATAHVVVLPIDVGDVDDRRHWHTACWANRANRSPTRRWS